MEVIIGMHLNCLNFLRDCGHIPVNENPENVWKLFFFTLVVKVKKRFVNKYLMVIS